jgi:hypothetical protein
MRWLRSAGAVVGGFVLTAALSVGTDAILHGAAVFPPLGVRMSDSLFALAAGYRALYTVAGGYVTARLAPSSPMAHAGVLAGIGVLAGLGGVAASLAHPELGPLWYAASIPVSAIPSITLGARLR